MFKLVSDHDGHWFILPARMAEQWSAWSEFAERHPDDARGWDVPDYARHVDGPHAFTFDSYVTNAGECGHAMRMK